MRAGPRLKVLSVVAGALLSGCASGLVREPPVADWQRDWSGELLAAATDATDGNSRWWRVFADPVLDELIARADARNLELRVAEASVRAARAQRDGATASLFPQFDVQAEFSRVRYGEGGRGFDNSAGLATAASWEADLFGRLRHERRATAAELQASEADRDAVRLTLLAEVARSYIELRLYRTQQNLTEKTAQAQEATLRITRVRYREGMSSRLDLERASALLAMTRAQIPQARELAESALHRLVLLTASTPAVVAALLPPAQTTSLPDSDAQAVLLTPMQVVAQRPDVRAADRRLLAAAASRRAAQSLRYPQLNLSALIGLESDQVGELLDGTRTWSVGAGLLAPLFDFGRIRAAIDVADARQEQAYLRYELSVRTALQEAQTALVLYTEGKRRQQELARAATAARNAATLARRQYGEGVLSMFEVLDAERSLFDAELSWSQATAEVSLRLVSLYQTMGVIPPPAQPSS